MSARAKSRKLSGRISGVSEDEKAAPATPAARRRRRRRHSARGQAGSAQGAREAITSPVADREPLPTPAPASASESAPATSAARAEGKTPRRKRPAAREARQEHGLRDIVGAGRSQIGVSGALRARDVARPSDEDLAQAERDTVIVRRNWTPPASS